MLVLEILDDDCQQFGEGFLFGSEIFPRIQLGQQFDKAFVPGFAAWRNGKRRGNQPRAYFSWSIGLRLRSYGHYFYSPLPILGVGVVLLASYRY